MQFQASNPTPAYPSKIHAHMYQETCTDMFITTLSVKKATDWKLPKYPSTLKQICIELYMHTMILHAAGKINQLYNHMHQWG